MNTGAYSNFNNFFAKPPLSLVLCGEFLPGHLTAENERNNGVYARGYEMNGE